jgi:hypothetical protein
MSHSAVLQRALHAYRGGSGMVASISLSGPAPVQHAGLTPAPRAQAAWHIEDDDDGEALQERLMQAHKAASQKGMSPDEVREVLRMYIKNPEMRRLMLHVHSVYLEHCAEDVICDTLLNSIPFLVKNGMFLNRLPERLGRARFNVRRQGDRGQYHITLCAYILAAVIAVRYAGNMLVQGLLEKVEARLLEAQAGRFAAEPPPAVEAREVVDAAAEMVNELAAEE